MFFLVLLISTIYAEKPIITKEFTEQLKKSVSWEVQDYEKNPFRDLTFSQLKSLHFADDELKNSNENYNFPILESDSHIKIGDIPDFFDARQIWPNCIHRVRNIGRCSCSWSMAPTSMTSDRYCIKGKDHFLAPQDPVSCSGDNKGCEGGWLEKSMNYMQNVGAVEEQCFPYTSGNLGDRPNCRNQCVTPNIPFIKYRCVNVRRIIETYKIKEEIMLNGPITTRFDLYADFYSYTNGVYYHQSGDHISGLAVKVIGWGFENDMAYWLCQNSWGPSWGIGGFFKIKQGDCAINDNFFACDPLI